MSKIALILYSAKIAALARSTGPIFGASKDIHHVVMLLFACDTKDIRPDDSIVVARMIGGM